MPRRRRFRLNYPFLLAILLFVGAIVAYIGIGVVINTSGPRRVGHSSSLYLAFVSRCLDATLAVWFFAIGASIGSFLNVVAYRLPLGRTLGGHSACPFCTTQIASADNIPVLAWLRLRGRCRTCRLPISIQYPLVELAVGLIFLSIYFLEFGIGGSNLPGSAARPHGLGLIWISVPQVLIVRVLLLVFLISGFIAATLIILRGSQVPMSLFGWSVLLLVVPSLIWPQAIVVNWSGLPGTTLISHLDVLITLSCGLGCGLILGLLSLPLIYQSDNRTSADYTAQGRAAESDATIGSLAWVGVASCSGLLLGWQALPTLLLWILLVTLVAGLLWPLVPKAISWTNWLNPVIWAWLGLILCRASWKVTYDALEHLKWFDGWGRHLWPMVVVLPLCWIIGRLRSTQISTGSSIRKNSEPLGQAEEDRTFASSATDSAAEPTD